MPYKSKAQARLFHHLESIGEMPKKTVSKYDKMTEFEDLPEHVKKAMGGIIHELADSSILEHPVDTTGEPHTEGEREEEHPMEYMAHGGKAHYSKGGKVHGVHKMARGGQVEHEEESEKKGVFAKHLAKKLRGF